MKHSRDTDVNSALLSLYECAINPAQFSEFLTTTEAWLSNHATPEGLIKMEAVSEPLWENLTETHIARIAAPRGTVKMPIMELAAFGVPVDPAEQHQWDDFESCVFAPDLARLRTWMSQCAEGAETLIRAATGDADIQVFLITKARDHFVIVDTETELSASVEAILSDSFAITHSEISVLRQLVVGGSVQSISKSLGKSIETVRTQIKSLAQKLSVNRQQDIQRVVDNIQTKTAGGASVRQPARDGRLRMITRAGGRRLHYAVYGADDGLPVVICNDFSGGSHLPAGTQSAFSEAGLKAVVLTRAGYGMSGPVALEGRDLVASHCADYMAVLDAENAGTFVALGIGTGMALACTLAQMQPTRVGHVFGLNVYPPVLSHADALQYKSGMYRVGALASLYAPKTLRVLTKFVVAQAARIQSAKQLLALSNTKHAEPKAGDAGSYFAEYLKPNLDDILLGKGAGSAADCTYLGVDWAQGLAQNAVHPKVQILHHFDFPFVKASFVRGFASAIGADFIVVESKFRESHRDVENLARHIVGVI